MSTARLLRRAALVAALCISAGRSRIDMKVSPSFTGVPGSAVVLVLIMPDPDNTAVTIEYDGPSQASATTHEVGPETRSVRDDKLIKDLPQGCYQVVATLWRSGVGKQAGRVIRPLGVGTTCGSELD